LDRADEAVYPAGIPGVPRMNLWVKFRALPGVSDKLAADGDRVKMLPVHNAEGWKNPDYLINASLWELESPNGSRSFINHAIRDG
jgi:hypothetical protein